MQPLKLSLKILNNTGPKRDSYEIHFICLTGLTVNHWWLHRSVTRVTLQGFCLNHGVPDFDVGPWCIPLSLSRYHRSPLSAASRCRQTLKCFQVLLADWKALVLLRAALGAVPCSPGLDFQLLSRAAVQLFVAGVRGGVIWYFGSLCLASSPVEKAMEATPGVCKLDRTIPYLISLVQRTVFHVTFFKCC